MKRNYLELFDAALRVLCVLACASLFVGLAGCVTSSPAASTGSTDSTDVKDLKISPDIKAASSLEFMHHEENVPFGSYLSMNLPFAPAKSLFDAIQKKTGKKLINRGEAHITVITPVEFDNGLKNHISIEKIHQIADAAKIQAASFDVVCLGYGEIKANGEELSTYFVVVKSQDLVDIRKSVQKAFIDGGGESRAFNPEDFYPHITIGFTKRDLHIADGVVKDQRSCLKK